MYRTTITRLGSFLRKNRLALMLLLFLGILLGLIILQPLVRQRQQAIAPPFAVPAGFFGLTINHWQEVPWPAIPFGSLRTWDTGVVWTNINITPGFYNWSQFDSLVNLAISHGVDVLFTFGQTPRWASSKPNVPTPYGPGLCAPPANISYWDDFVRAVVTRARGRIKFWEIWNEPQDESFYCGDVATMVKLQAHAYKIIKGLDPRLIVLTPSPVGGQGPKWMSKFLTSGGGQYADVMAFHGYSDNNAELIVTVIDNFKNVFTANGQSSKPIWDTEASWGETAKISDPDLQVAFLAKHYLLHWSSGVARFYWYSYDNKRFGGLWDAARGPRKAAIAYAQVYKWMVGAKLDAPCSVQWFTGTWMCRFSRLNGYNAVAIWNSGGSTSYVPPPQYRQYRDLDGNIFPITGEILIGDKPVLIETNTAF